MIGFKRNGVFALCAALVLSSSLSAQDKPAEKSQLKFRPPGSKSVERGRSRIRLGESQANAASQAGAATQSASQQSQAKPPVSQTNAAQQNEAEQNSSQLGEVVTAAFRTQQDRYADRYSDDDSPRVANDTLTDDDFFGGTFSDDNFGDDDVLPPPPNFFRRQDDAQPGAAPVTPIPQGSTQDQFHCPTKAEMGIRNLTTIGLDISPNEPTPQDCPLFDEPWVPRHWMHVDFFWKASAICHKPLYFEDVALERYGHSHGMFVQPFVSGAHFFAAIPLLPYKMGLQHPHDCVYPLGYYRPGSCAPKLMYPLPLSWRGALYQGAASTGLVFLIP